MSNPRRAVRVSAPTVGRSAIELIKDEMRIGRGDRNKWEWRDFLTGTFKSSQVPLDAVSNWTRTASLEIQAGLEASVTNKVRANGYKTNSAPTPAERKAGRKPRRRDTATRVHNDGIEAGADATRTDATVMEQAIPQIYASVEALLGAIRTLSETP